MIFLEPQSIKPRVKIRFINYNYLLNIKICLNRTRCD